MHTPTSIRYRHSTKPHFPSLLHSEVLSYTPLRKVVILPSFLPSLSLCLSFFPPLAVLETLQRCPCAFCAFFFLYSEQLNMGHLYHHRVMPFTILILYYSQYYSTLFSSAVWRGTPYEKRSGEGGCFLVFFSAVKIENRGCSKTRRHISSDTLHVRRERGRGGVGDFLESCIHFKRMTRLSIAH